MYELRNKDIEKFICFDRNPNYDGILETIIEGIVHWKVNQDRQKLHFLMDGLNESKRV